MREIEFVDGTFSWITYTWRRYPAPFGTERMREVRRFDDYMSTDDLIEGGPGNDILHGQGG